MKTAKTMMTILLSAGFLNIASAELNFEPSRDALTVSGVGNLSEINQWIDENKEVYTGQYLQLKDITLTVNDFILPTQSYISFQEGTKLNFNEIKEIHYDDEYMPQLYVGNTEDFPFLPGSLTISLSNEAMTGMLNDKDLSVRVDGLLLSSCYFFEVPGSNVSLVLHNEKGEEIKEGSIYKYNEHEYVNAGVIYNLGDLKRDQIALFFSGDYDPEGWGTGSFSIVALGPEFVVPEPTTGSLSLLALAGLAARRRRK